MLGKSGINEWKHAHEVLQSHENSADHLEYQKKWFETSLRLKSNKTIHMELQSKVENNANIGEKFWNVLFASLNISGDSSFLWLLGLVTDSVAKYCKNSEYSTKTSKKTKKQQFIQPFNYCKTPLSIYKF